ncbi:MAG: HEPN domain-containing protein [Methanocella sp.]
MSKENEARALMFLYDAVTDKVAMECASREKLYPPAVFHAQQTNEKAAKACLALKSIFTKEHEYTPVFRREIILNSGSLKDDFLTSLKDMIRLESLNTEPRYSVTHRDIHYTQYTDKTIEGFCILSKRVLELCFRFVELKTGIDALPRERDDLGKYILDNYSSYIHRKEI